MCPHKQNSPFRFISCSIPYTQSNEHNHALDNCFPSGQMGMLPGNDRGIIGGIYVVYSQYPKGCQGFYIEKQ